MYITINSEFKPFTYDELTKPLRDYTEAYNKVEEQYATLAQQTEAWKNIATQENSPEAYAMYKKYSDELNAVVEDFSRGMTIQNRGKLTGLKSRYASEITPIANAYNAMQAANKYRDDVRAKDSTAVFIKNRYSSIDDFLHGKEADNNYISGSQIEASILGKTYAKANEAFTELTKDGRVNADTAARLVMSGQSFNINDVINEELEAVGADRFDPESRQMLEAYIASGVEKGFGSFIEKQTLTAQQREDIRLRERSIATQSAATAESRRQFNARMRSEGRNTDGSIDPNSSYWSTQGITFTENEDGTLTVHSSEGNLTIDGSIYFNSAGETYVYNSDKVESRKIVSLSDVLGSAFSAEALASAYSNIPVGSLDDSTKIEVITLKDGAGTMYKIHQVNEASVQSNATQVGSGSGTVDPDNYN